MPQRVSDLELLEWWRAGSRSAGNQLVKRHFVGVRGYFVAKFTEDHEDLTQETFSRVVAGRDRFRGGTFKAYLYSIARNVSHEYLRKRYKHTAPLEASSLVDLTGRRQSSILAEREEHRLLLDALRRLPLEEQELVELHYWQRLTGAELGGVYDRPESTIRGRLRTALKRLGELHRELGGKAHSRELSERDIERWLEALREQLGRAPLRPEHRMSALVVTGVSPVSLDGSIDSSNALQVKHGSSSLASHDHTLHARHSALNPPATGTIRIELMDFSHGGASWQVGASHTSGVVTVHWSRGSNHAYYDFAAMAHALEVAVSATSNASPPQTKTRTVWIKTMPTDGQ